MQLFVSSDIRHPAVIENQNLIRMPHRGNSLGDDDFVISGSSSLSIVLILASVAVSTALVESSRINTFGCFKIGSCNTDSLLLAS